MICQEILIGFTRSMNLVGILINEKSTYEVIHLGDKNPNKPPKKKQKKKKKAVEDSPVKKYRKS